MEKTSNDMSLDAFWKYREDTFNNALKSLGINASISLKTTEEQTIFIEALKAIEEKDFEDVKKLEISDGDVLLLKGESSLMGEKLKNTILNATGKKVFIVCLRTESDLIKLVPGVLAHIDQGIGGDKKAETIISKNENGETVLGETKITENKGTKG